MVYNSLVPRPSPSFPSFAVRKVGEGLVIYTSSCEWRHGQEKIMWTWVSCKPKKLRPHTHSGARLFRVERWQHTKVLLCCSSRDSREDREFYQAKTVKTHSNNLVMLAHVQLKSFYHLSTCDITHMRKCTRTFPPYCTASDGRAWKTRLGFTTHV